MVVYTLVTSPGSGAVALVDFSLLRGCPEGQSGTLDPRARLFLCLLRGIGVGYVIH
jgi:hypothetical protein